MNRAYLIAIGQTILATVIWGSTFIFGKFILMEMGPLMMAGLRYLIAFLIFLPWLYQSRTQWLLLPKEAWMRLILLGLLTYTIGNGAMFGALNYLSATTASLVMGTVPLFVMLAENIWLQERPSRLQIAGVLISLLGAALFFMRENGEVNAPGLLLSFVAIVGLGIFAVMGRELTHRFQVSIEMLTGFPFFFGCIGLLAAAISFEGWPTVSGMTWFYILWLGVINTALAFWACNAALRQLTALELNVIVYTSPLLTALLAWLFLNETITMLQLVSMVIVISGVLLVHYRPRAVVTGIPEIV